MRHGVVAGILGWVGLLLVAWPAMAAADVVYELRARTFDALLRGTVEYEEQVTVSVKGDRLRQEESGTRSVQTRRGARYMRPGHHLTIDQLDRSVRYEINLDAGTYVEESLTGVRRRHEESVAAAEKALRIDPQAPLPSLAVQVEKTGERQQVNGQDCERVVLKATREVVVAASRGGQGSGAPVRFAMTFDVCLAPDAGPARQARMLLARVEDLTGARGALAERELRVLGERRDVYAVFDLMRRLMEREQERLSGWPVRWERAFLGPRRDQPQATLYRQTAEVTRVEEPALDPVQFELPAGLTLDRRGATP